MRSGPIPVLVISSWYPSSTDPAAGRFVADQVRALGTRGDVDPAVVSFDPADLIGSGSVRARVATAVNAQVSAAVRTADRVFLGPGLPWSAAPLARVGVPSGRYRAVGVAHALASRIPALDALADRWLSGREVDVPRPSVIHAHTVYPDGAAAAHLAARLACPLIVTEHASTVDRLISTPEIRAAYLATVRSAYRLVVVSHSLASELIRSMPEIGPKVTVIPNAVDLAAFESTGAAPRRADELLFVGYRKVSKGISTLFQATALARKQRPRITLRLIGSSPTEAIEADWRREAEALGIADAVTFDGAATRTEVAAAMARASLFVHPSPRETFGVVAVEALASGLPIVAVDSGGVTEILGPDRDAIGAVVPQDRPDLLAAAIIAALERDGGFDPARLRAAAAPFAAATVAGDLAALYDEAIAAQPGVRRAEQDRSTDDPTGGAKPTAGADTAAVTGNAARVTDMNERRLIVALDPTRAAEVARVVLAASAEPGPTLVTTTGWNVPQGAFRLVIRTPPGVRISGLADAAVLRSGRAGPGRILQLLRHPLALARRRGWIPGLEDRVIESGGEAIRSALEAMATVAADGSRPAARNAMSTIICADGIDHLAADAVIASGAAVPAPGGIRWLGDALADPASRG